MMIKSGYQEGLYYQQGFPAPTEALEEQLRALLRENHGVGILGGSYENGFPLCMVSELALQMLGYSTFAEMEEATGNCMAGLICSSDYSEEGFAALTGECELFLRGKEENRWVRLVKRDAVFPGVDKKLWIASVCDMDALYQKELQVNQMTMEKRRQDLAQQAKLAQANRRLEHQTIALEHALAEARLNNEVISAIGKVYWLIYRLDLEAGTFQQVSVSDTSHCILGDHGITAERFPESCKNTVMPAYQPVMQAFLDPSTLPDRLAEREEISQEYETITGNWHVGRFIVQKRNEYGRVTRALYAIQIINEQKKQELEYEKRLAGIAEEAQRASLSKTDFLRRMSHDIRTPINGIRGMIEIANHCADDLQKQQECRQKVWEASGYLLSLVNSVLDMNKLESGAVVLAHTPFDMMQLLKEADSVSSIEKAIVQNGARLIILDPIQAYMGDKADMNKANEVRPIFRRLADVAERTGCAVILIGHLNKAAGGQSAYRGLGSIDFRAAARSVLLIGRVKREPNVRVIVHDKSSLAPEGKPVAFCLDPETGFSWIGEYDITADELLSGAGGNTATKTEQAEKLILDLLADGKELASEDIVKAAAEAGISERTVQNAKRNMGSILGARRVGGQWYNFIKKKQPPEPAS